MVSRAQVTSVAPEELRLDALPSATRKAFIAATSFRFLRRSRWYLGGGTALALQAGHRQSVDLDFFTPERRFSELALEASLMEEGAWGTSLKESHTLYGKFEGAKISFIAYPFFYPSKNQLRCGNVSILLPRDIAAMKIIAVSQRGRKRDFVDLYWYCTFMGSLQEAIERAVRQYPHQEHSLPHFLKSLVYFEDAEADPMPKLFFDVDWRTIKRFFQSEVPRITKEILKKR